MCIRDSYKAAGGWENGLEDHLNGLYRDLTEAQQRACRAVFQQLSELDRGRAVRRRVSLGELAEVCGEEARGVVQEFVSAGFLVVHSEVVDVTHECVLRSLSLIHI